MAENLTKENCFNAIYAKYPKAMDIFCKWVDKYKLENEFDILFNAGMKFRSGSVESKAPKFHELPYAFQLGMWIEFVSEQGGCEYEIDLFDFDLAEDIEVYMREVLQSHIKETSDA